MKDRKRERIVEKYQKYRLSSKVSKTKACHLFSKKDPSPKEVEQSEAGKQVIREAAKEPVEKLPPIYINYIPN